MQYAVCAHTHAYAAERVICQLAARLVPTLEYWTVEKDKKRERPNEDRPAPRRAALDFPLFFYYCLHRTREQPNYCARRLDCVLLRVKFSLNSCYCKNRSILWRKINEAMNKINNNKMPRGATAKSSSPPAGMQTIINECMKMYPDQPNPLQVTTRLKYW